MKQNINATGRFARGGIGLLLLLAAGCLVPVSGFLAIFFAVAGIFAVFEASKGWCGVRACGIKTPF
ncbi:MAG: YgaP-like transmembrane domain [Chthoniobacterales bacterium]